MGWKKWSVWFMCVYSIAFWAWTMYAYTALTGRSESFVPLFFITFPTNLIGSLVVGLLPASFTITTNQQTGVSFFSLIYIFIWGLIQWVIVGGALGWIAGKIKKDEQAGS